MTACLLYAKIHKNKAENLLHLMLYFSVLQFLKKVLAFWHQIWYYSLADFGKTEYGRLAQLVEHLLDVQEVTGSSPVPSTIQFVLEPDSLRKRVRVRFLFIGGSAEGLLGTVNRNEQRQGIIVVMVSCLLFCGIKVALCELDRHLYGALMAIAAYVRTGSLYTSDKV